SHSGPRAWQSELPASKISCQAPPPSASRVLAEGPSSGSLRTPFSAPLLVSTVGDHRCDNSSVPSVTRVIGLSRFWCPRLAIFYPGQFPLLRLGSRLLRFLIKASRSLIVGLSGHTLLVTLLIAFICVRSSFPIDYGAHSFFEVVTMCDLIMILVFYLVHLFRLYRVLTCISWPLSELLHYLIGTLLLFIASIVIASKNYNLVAGAIFGFLASFLCLASLWLSYKITCITQSSDISA
uniref:CKLF-like MARVEL transmembrane domain containing 7 n=1 Tax=Rattus norvegicus TaxID=10116 RepID=A0A8I6A7G4_RAT